MHVTILLSYLVELELVITIKKSVHLITSNIFCDFKRQLQTVPHNKKYTTPNALASQDC